MDFRFGSEAADNHELSSLPISELTIAGSGLFFPAGAAVDARASKGETKSNMDFRLGDGGCAWDGREPWDRSRGGSCEYWPW